MVAFTVPLFLELITRVWGIIRTTILCPSVPNATISRFPGLDISLQVCSVFRIAKIEVIAARAFFTGHLCRRRFNALEEKRFREYAEEEGIARVQVCLEPGDLYFFYSETIHEVPFVVGSQPRVVLASFIGMSEDDPEVYLWS